MTAISNFTQAMKELTGFDEEPAKPEPKKEKPEIKNTPVRQEEPKRQVPAFDDKDGSLVTGTMVITGSITSSDQVKIDGKVSGDLKTSRSAMVNGTVMGDIDACDLTVNGAVKGDLRVDADTDVAAAAVIVGNITSRNLRLKGKVKGNLAVSETTGIAETAILAGDIDTGELYTEKGCVVHGAIRTRDTAEFNFEEEKLFDIGE